MSKQLEAYVCVFCAIVRLTHPDWCQPGNAVRCTLCGRRFCHVHGHGEVGAVQSTMCVLHRQLPFMPNARVNGEASVNPVDQRPQNAANDSHGRSIHQPEPQTEHYQTIPQQQVETSVVAIPEVRVEPSTSPPETWSKSIEYNGKRGCCVHSAAQYECRRSTCCTHGDPNLCVLRQSTRRSTRRHYDFVPQVQNPNTPRIMLTNYGDTNESIFPEGTVRQDRSMLNADRPPFFVPQLGRVTALKGRQHLYIRGIDPIPVPPKMWPNGMLVHLTEDMYMLLQVEQVVICVSVPYDGGTFTTSSGLRLYLHPTHGVIRLGRKQIVGDGQVRRMNLEILHDNSVVRQIIANMAMVEKKVTRMFDSPKAEWMPPSLVSPATILTVDTTISTAELALDRKVLAVHDRVPVRGWVERLASKEAYVSLPMLPGLCEWLCAELKVPRLLLMPRSQRTEDKVIKVFALDELLTRPAYSVSLVVPYLGRNMELDELRLLLLKPVHQLKPTLDNLDDQNHGTACLGPASTTVRENASEKNAGNLESASTVSNIVTKTICARAVAICFDVASEDGKLENSSTTEFQSTKDEVSSFSSLKSDMWVTPKEKSRLRRKASQIFAKTKDVIKAVRVIWRYMI